MTARLTIVRTQPLEPIRLAEPRYTSDAAVIVLWIAVAFGLIAIWSTVGRTVWGWFQ